MAWAENIYFSSQGFTLDIPRFEFPDQGVTCVWGASGAGKSTFLQCLAGLIKVPHLKLHIGGECVSDLPLRERNTGFVFQDFALFPHMTVRENMNFAAISKNLPRETWKVQADSLINKLSLEKVLDQRADVLSGGEQQRVALARALVTKPRIVFLDEPLSALDEKLRGEARVLIHDLSKEYKVPFILVTHDFRDVRAISSAILVLANGVMMGSGLTLEVLTDPPDLSFARLMPENQVLKIVSRNDGYYLSDQRLSSTRLKAGPQLALLAKNWSFEVVSGLAQGVEVIDCVDLGPFRDCQIRLADGQIVRGVSQLSLNELVAGNSVDLKVDESSMILFKVEV